MRVESPNLAERVLAAVKIDADSPEELDVDPDTSAWLRLRLMLLSLFVPESQL